MKWHKLSDFDYSCKQPAPVLREVVVNHLDRVRCSPSWSALIDSGADFTVIPTSAASHLGLNVVNAKKAKVSFCGEAPQECPFVYVQISHETFGLLQPVKAAVMDRKTILIGRDCIRQLLFMIHGPTGKFIIHQHRSWWSLFCLRFTPTGFRRNIEVPQI